MSDRLLGHIIHDGSLRNWHVELGEPEVYLNSIAREPAASQSFRRVEGS